MQNEHGNFGSIFTGIENLFSLEQGIIESFHFNFSKYLKRKVKKLENEQVLREVPILLV